MSAVGVALPGRLQPTDLELAPGWLTVLVGPNGSGKTSLLHALAGIGRPSGSVEVAGHALETVTAQRRPSVLGYVPASRDLAWPLSVRALVALTAPRASRSDVDDLLETMALTDLAERPVDRLSTGERSRVLIARALLPRPAVLLLDEPFANLDPLWQIRLADTLRAEAAAGMTILVSAHDLDLAARLSGRMLVIDAGQVAADAAPQVLLGDGTIERVFGVKRDEDGGWRAA